MSQQQPQLVRLEITAALGAVQGLRGRAVEDAVARALQPSVRAAMRALVSSRTVKQQGWASQEKEQVKEKGRRGTAAEAQDALRECARGGRPPRPHP